MAEFSSIFGISLSFPDDFATQQWHERRRQNGTDSHFALLILRDHVVAPPASMHTLCTLVFHSAQFGSKREVIILGDSCFRHCSIRERQVGDDVKG